MFLAGRKQKKMTGPYFPMGLVIRPKLVGQFQTLILNCAVKFAKSRTVICNIFSHILDDSLKSGLLPI